MSARFTIEEALSKGWISKTEAAAQKAKSVGKPGSSGHPKKNNKRKKTSSLAVCSIEGDMPQEKLWRACVKRWPTWVIEKKLVWEFQGAVPGRKFRLDIAIPENKLAIEVDGWEFHGKFLSDFKRDRARDRALVRNGWRVLRFYAEEIHADPHLLAKEIEASLFC
jgi:very-short-patch-repair endonuclease